ncbi:alanine racemase [Sphingorhabdus sp.]|uniref:alanine racemase n=1 Tax=Sphingorhabdus sp. TaxID=1902408 RepID=UPI0039199DDD
MNDFEAPLRLYLNGEALVSNWHALDAQSGTARAGAAVKADAYGLGAREVVARLRDAGCRNFFVAHWAEAAAIADIVPPTWISVLNGIAPTDVPGARQLGAIPVLNTPEQVAMWRDSGGGRCHIMFDSGINRLGLASHQICSGIFDDLEVDLLLSHLASADMDVHQNGQQLRQFQSLTEAINARRFSLANSAGIMLGPDYHFDVTRPGLSLYGGIARYGMESFIRPVVTISARLLQVRTVPAGAPVGYNATHRCKRETRVGTVSLGYADGYLRAFSGKGQAFLGDRVIPVIGRVSMDLVTLDLTTAPELREGDWVEIDYDLAASASLTGLSQYELLTNIGSRFERMWR